MLVELNLLNCTEGKRGLKRLGYFKSILQEGPFQVATGILNLWICLMGTEDIVTLDRKQISNIHIGTAEHLVLAYHGPFIYHMWKSMLISNWHYLIYLEPKRIYFPLDFYKFLGWKTGKAIDNGIVSVN